MTAKAQWLARSGGLVLFGLLVVAVGVADGDDPRLVAMIGGAFAISGGALTAHVLRSFTPDRRLPEHLRHQEEPSAPRTLVLTGGQRILAIEVLSGGYVTARRTDPSFDARDVVDVTVATRTELEVEAARRPHLDQTHPALWFVSIGSLYATVFGFAAALAAGNVYAWFAWCAVATTWIGCLLRLAVLRRRESPD